jgi:CRISPR-associated endonuclease/helicase Cas3
MEIELSIWGKAKGLSRPYPLLAHLVDTAAAAYTLLAEHLPTQTLDALGLNRSDDKKIRNFAFLAGLHDLGKATPAFQSKDKGSKLVLQQMGYSFPAGSPLFHDRATQLTLPEALGLADTLGGPLDGALGAACMLGGHHGVFHRLGNSELRSDHRANLSSSNPQLGTGRWEEQRIGLVEALMKATGVSEIVLHLAKHQLVLGAGVVVIADWLASQKNSIGCPADWPAWEDLDWVTWFERKVEASSDAVRAAGLSAPTVSRRSFQELFNRVPRPLQDSLERFFHQRDRAPGILLITAPMGVGKTEAALLASQRMGAQDSGILFLLPTMATADAMFERVVDYAQRVVNGDTVEVSLVHSMASLNQRFDGLPERNENILSDDDNTSKDDSTIAVASQWLRGRRRTLLAPVAAGTIDQVLAASLKGRRGFLRWLGLSGKTVIIDEAHSFDAYMHGLLLTVLTWLGRFGVPVIVMSATLPQRIASEMVSAWCKGAGIEAPNAISAYPGWLFVGDDGAGHGFVQSEIVSVEVKTAVEVKTVRVPDWPTAWMSTVKEHLAPIQTEGCALVVCNTVADAQRLAISLVPWAAENGIELSCLHARFRQDDRRRITEEVLAKFGPKDEDRPHKAILVATQIVEQSLDVDFDIVLSCLSPVAALLQRAGRGHRHPRSSRPEGLRQPLIEVFVPVDQDGELAAPSAWCFVYPEVYLQRTWDSALGRGVTHRWTLPDDVQGLVDAVYGELDDARTDDALLAQLDREWLDARANPDARIPTPDAMGSLFELTSSFDEELLLATRLGISTIQVVCAWQHPSGLCLDREGTIPMPTVVDPEAARLALAASIPLNRLTRAAHAIVDASTTPAGWADDPWLTKSAVLVLDPVTADAYLGEWHFKLDPLTGLCWESV